MEKKKPQCEETVVLGGTKFRCVKPDHSWPGDKDDRTANHRRRYGKVVEPDRHVFRKEES